MTARPQSRSCVGASLGWTMMLLREEVDTEAYDVSATPCGGDLGRHAREERVYRHALFGHQRCVELFPVVGRPRVAKAVDLVIEVIDDVLLRFIQLLLRGR